MTLGAFLSVLPVAEAAKTETRISIFRIRPGQFEAFMTLQLAHLERIRGTVPGVLGGRMFTSADRDTVVFVSSFETAEAADRFRHDPRFQDHLAQVGALIDSSEALPVELAYEIGAI